MQLTVEADGPSRAKRKAKRKLDKKGISFSRLEATATMSPKRYKVKVIK